VVVQEEVQEATSFFGLVRLPPIATTHQEQILRLSLDL
jgi:hypothetical protein